MSDAPQPFDEIADPGPELLEADAIDLEKIALLRRSPRFGRMFGTGIGLGGGLGFIGGLLLPSGDNGERFVAALWLGLAIGLLGAIIAGVVATRLDAASAAHTDRARAQGLNRAARPGPSESDA